MGLLQFHRTWRRASRAGQGVSEGILLEVPQRACRGRQRVPPVLPRAARGQALNLAEFDYDLPEEVVEQAELGERTLRFSGDVDEALERIGHVPLPPYIRRPDEPTDRERYQTVFAKEKGSVAAPTAGLHFTPEILARCPEIAYVTLHVGLGTFQPLHEGHKLHSELYENPPETAA